MLKGAKSEPGANPALGNRGVTSGRGEENVYSAPSRRTDCCIVGAGPAGAVLGLLLARKGVSVTLLEAHKDFDREFRGNTINPSVSRLTGMPVQRETMLAISASVTSSRSSRWPPCLAASCSSSAASRRSSSGSRPWRSSAARLRS